MRAACNLTSTRGLRRVAALLTLLAGCEADERPVLRADGGTGHSHDDGSHTHELESDGSVPEDGSAPDAGDRPLADAGGDASHDGFAWALPYRSFPRPVVPADNPMSVDKVELGRHLFYDKRLSVNHTFSCASCHQQERAFADGLAVGVGATGERHSRGSMSLANVAYAQSLTWSNPLMTELERQLHVPLFGDKPVELGLRSGADLEQRLREVPRYAELFQAAFAGEAQPITMLNVSRAIASFQRTLISGNSPFDRYYYGGDESALSEPAKRGLALVTVESDHRFECNHCHGQLPFFSDHVTWEGLDLRGVPLPFHQTGLYDEDGQGSYPAPNVGVLEITLRPEDRGKFKAPTLRNIALTAPYMHDGSIATLDGVLDHYAQGGRQRNRSQTDPVLQPVDITPREKADIIAFLESLTDQEFITNPKFTNPWPANDPLNGTPAPASPAP